MFADSVFPRPFAGGDGDRGEAGEKPAVRRKRVQEDAEDQTREKWDRKVQIVEILKVTQCHVTCCYCFFFLKSFSVVTVLSSFLAPS